jgi:CP family cyanate transporter-like MFS transporter
VRRGPVILLLLGLVFVALNLRLALTSVGPLIDELRADLGVSGAVVGLLTTAPLLAFGLVAPFAPRLADRVGTERLVLLCLLAIAVGIAVRLAPPLVFLFGGTLILGVGIAIANVLLPGIVKARFGDRAAFMTGVYSVALTAGAAIAAGLTVPIERWVGDWRIALAFWALPAVVAGLVWLPQVRRRDREDAVAPRAPDTSEPVRLWRDRRAWEISVAMGLQSLIFYVTVAWLPELLRDMAGMTSGAAGALASLAMVMGIPAGLAMSVAAGRMRDQRPLAALVVVLTAVGWLGLLLAADVSPLLWSLVLGIGEGGCFTLVLTLFVLRARDARHAAELSGMAQAAGYTLAAFGPLAIGALHDASGSWKLPLAVMLAITCAQVGVLLAASRPGFVGRHPAPPSSSTGPSGHAAPAVSR